MRKNSKYGPKNMNFSYSIPKKFKLTRVCFKLSILPSWLKDLNMFPIKRDEQALSCSKITDKMRTTRKRSLTTFTIYITLFKSN